MKYLVFGHFPVRVSIEVDADSEKDALEIVNTKFLTLPIQLVGVDSAKISVGDIITWDETYKLE